VAATANRPRTVLKKILLIKSLVKVRASPYQGKNPTG
jgi:hypothetical protein